MPEIETQTDYWNDVELPEKLASTGWDSEKVEWKQTGPAFIFERDIPTWAFDDCPFRGDRNIGLFIAGDFIDQNYSELIKREPNQEPWDDKFTAFLSEREAIGHSYIFGQAVDAIINGVYPNG